MRSCFIRKALILLVRMKMNYIGLLALLWVMVVNITGSLPGAERAQGAILVAPSTN